MRIKSHQMETIFGLSTNGIKLYERAGILSPERLAGNGYRVYRENDLQSMGYAAQLRRFGFSMQETSELMRQGNISALQDAYRKREDEIEQEIEHLSRMRKSLKQHRELCQEAQALLDTCKIDQAPAMYFLAMRSRESFLSDASPSLANEWFTAYTPYTFSAILLDGLFSECKNTQQSEYGIVVPGHIAHELGLKPSPYVTYMLPRPCIVTACHFSYEQSDFSAVTAHIASYANHMQFALSGGALCFITDCHLSEDGVQCTALVYAPSKSAPDEYGILR